MTTFGDRSPEQFRLLVESIPNGVLVVDSKGSIIFANSEAERVFGYSSGELIGKPVEMLIPLGHRDAHVGLRKSFDVAHRKRPMGTSADLAALRKDGTDFPAEIGLSYLDTPEGRITIASVADRTMRRQAAKEQDLIERAEERLEHCEQLGLPAAALRLDGTVVRMNHLMGAIETKQCKVNESLVFQASSANDRLLEHLAMIRSGKIDGKIGHSFPIPETRHHLPAICVLLRMKGELNTAICILVIKMVELRGASSPQLIQGLFGLTKAEGKLASLVGGGLSPKHAAVQLGISEGTARTTLQHIYSKMGVSRQSELANLVVKMNLQ